MTQIQVDRASRVILAYGLFPAGTEDAALDILELPDAELPKLTLPGAKTLNADGTITVTPPPPDPPAPVQPTQAEQLAQAIAAANEQTAAVATLDEMKAVVTRLYANLGAILTPGSGLPP